MMYCVECAKEGNGTDPAIYIYNGKSLCYIDFWKEVENDK